MPRNDFPVDGRYVEEPISFIDVHRSVTSANSRYSTRVPWGPLGAVAASLGTPVGIGMLHPLLGEVLTGIEVLVVLTVIVTAMFGSQTLSERSFRLLRWFGNRPEPPPPGDQRWEHG